ncbi:MAG: PKD domain-containing protein [Lewinellaceae bacterium]|nr:PKD domain-containing protein [Lewinellaceae bacterium]
MKAIIFLAIFYITLNQLYSQHIFERQKRDYIWLIGNSPLMVGGNDMTKLDFNFAHLQVISIDIDMNFWHTNASISDALGQLQFYTNGIEVRNFNNDTLATGLAPTQMSEGFQNSGYPNEQGALILPLPSFDSIYYIFHADREWAPQGGNRVENLYYTKVHMEANEGMGRVVEKNMPVIEDTLTYGRITATRHANGRDWWIMVPQYYSNSLYSFLFSSGGISNLDLQTIGETIPSGAGQFVFSPDGTKYIGLNVVHIGDAEDYHIHIYDFDRCSGRLSNPQYFAVTDVSFPGGGVAISENSRFLYVVTWMNIYQFDLSFPEIEATKIKIAEYDGFEDPIYDLNTDFKLAQLGPNGKIYIACATSANYLHIIHTPNQKGLACKVEQHALELAALNDRSIPNFPYYGLGPLDGSPCDTLGIDNPPPQAAFSYVIEDSAAFQVDFYDGTRFSPESWLWDFGDGQSSTERFPVHAYAEAGVYEVCLTASNQTGSDTFCDTVNFLATGVQEAISMPPGFSVFPNPASSRLAVRSGRPFAGQRLSLYSVMGREVLAHGLPEGATSFAFSVAGLPPGVYFVSIWEGAAAVWSERVVVGRR